MTGPGIGQFKCTIDQVYGLCPEAERVTDGNSSRLPSPITEDSVAAWIVDVDSMVAGHLIRIDLISVGTHLTEIMAAARSAVANGAASYLESARYPARNVPFPTTYAGVLWDRCQAGIKALVDSIDKIIQDAGPDILDTGVEAGPFGAFPPTYFTDGAMW